LKGLKVSEIIQFEKAFEGILAVSKTNNIDLIVMGSHGSGGFQEMFIGSNTEKVVRNSDVPVLVIKNKR
jgi:nucleotide-binding universal stress UspA family protein